MKPIDYRNETWDSLQSRIVKVRAQVLAAWRQHGPCTTEELAARSGISILTLRPRTTELCQIGFVELAGGADGCGIYRALSDAQAQIVFERQKRAASKPQLELF